MLKIKDLHVYYGAFQALAGISMEVCDGEIVALLGGNGAGKSTTINTVSGILKASSGQMEFCGKDITQIAVDQRVQLGITQVPEGRKLFPAMTVLDNMLIGSYLKRTRAARKANMEKCFELFPKLYERKDQLAGSMSGGEQQMCAIARGLMQEPKLLMMDEPSLGLAPVVVDSVLDAIQKINKSGVTVLLVEQNVLASLDICNRAYVIETGLNVIDGDKEKLLGNADVRKAYIGI